MSISVNGVETTWEYLDPHKLIIVDELIEGNGEAYDVMQRASFMAANDGELCIKLPTTYKDVSFPPPTTTLNQDDGNLVRTAAFNRLKSRLSSDLNPTPLAIEVYLDQNTVHNKYIL